MGVLTKSKSRQEVERAWKENEERIARLASAFEAVERTDERDLLMLAMCERIWWLYDDCKLDEGDAILEFLPKPVAMRLLDEFFMTENQFDPEVLLDEI